MFSRLSLVARHLSPPRPSLKHLSTTAPLSRIMALADERNARTIHTAACLIIGDEVLGGKVNVPVECNRGATPTC